MRNWMNKLAGDKPQSTSNGAAPYMSTTQNILEPVPEVAVEGGSVSPLQINLASESSDDNNEEDMVRHLEDDKPEPFLPNQNFVSTTATISNHIETNLLEDDKPEPFLPNENYTSTPTNTSTNQEKPKNLKRSNSANSLSTQCDTQSVATVTSLPYILARLQDTLQSQSSSDPDSKRPRIGIRIGENFVTASTDVNQSFSQNAVIRQQSHNVVGTAAACTAPRSEQYVKSATSDKVNGKALEQHRRALGDALKSKIISAQTHCITKCEPEVFRCLVVPNAVSVTPREFGDTTPVVVASVTRGATKIFGRTGLGNWKADKMELVFYPAKKQLNCWWTMS